MGADRVQQGLCERFGDSNLTINGGTFKSQIAGGMAYTGQKDPLKGQAILTGNVNLTISGGSFSSWIYGGCITSAGYSTKAIIDGSVYITVDASEKEIIFGDDAHIVAGSYQFGMISGDTCVTLTGKAENLKMDADNLIWGGCSADVYLTKDGERIFQTMISGDRIIVFDDFDGEITARIRGFNVMEVVNGSDIEILNNNLSDIKVWKFDTESCLSGNFLNNFSGDELNIDLGSWDQQESTLIAGSIKGFDSLSKVTLGTETAQWNNAVSAYVSLNYQLTFDTENNEMKISMLA